ncbi:MAG: EF-hand domain-containing protein [Methylophilaceae bacterium]
MQINKIAAVMAASTVFIFAQAHAEDASQTPTATPHPGQSSHMLMMDTNHDGKISREEFRAAHEKRSEEHFKRMDTNGDGFIDEAEKHTAGEKMRELRKEWHEKHQKPEAAKPG